MSEQNTEWTTKFASWRSSGLSMTAWCRKNDESYHRFLYWRERLLPPRPKITGKFVSLRPAPAPTPPPISLECNGIYIHVTAGFDAGLLADILALLKRG